MLPETRALVSIVIPVFNQVRELQACLGALACQTYPADRFEVIVVDNGSEPPINDLVGHLSSVRWLREEEPGSYAARNRGVRAATGEILGFTDADCLPDPVWIERGVAAVHGLRGDGMVGGRIEPTFLDPARPTAAELYDCVFGYPQESFITWGFAATANLFTTRATFDRVGPFDEGLMSGGDMDWGQRVRALSLDQRYAADVRILHPARRTIAELVKKVLRIAGGNQQMADRAGQGTAGLASYAREQLVHVRRIRANLADPRLASLERKIRFASVVWLVDAVRTVERYRVHYGGAPSRT